MLDKFLFVSLSIAVVANCTPTSSNQVGDADLCDPSCEGDPDGGMNQPDGSATTADAGDVGDAGAADAGTADTDAGGMTPDAGEVVCNPNDPEIEGDLIDNDCDGLVDELEVCSNGPYQTIAAAIAAAPDMGTIEVCAGTYNERLTVTAKNLRIVGAGVGQTILDAQTLGRALTISNSSDIGVVLEGFTVRNGLSQGNGGAISCSNGGIELKEVEVIDSKGVFGGGLFATTCGVTLETSTFLRNKASQSGGGAHLVSSIGNITASEFSDNNARAGGGLSVVDGTMPIDLSKFNRNFAGLQGGGLHFRNEATISNSEFDDNNSGWTGGGIYLDQLAPTITNVKVRDNYSENDGGGIYTHQSNGEILDSVFTGNFSNDDGGGIRIFESEMLVQNNLVEDNEAADSGGGIRISHRPSTFRDNQVLNNRAFGVGGGFDLDNCSSRVIGGVIEGNTAGGSGGGIHAWLFPWFDGEISDVRIANNHAWQGGGIYLQHNFQSIKLSGLEVVGNTASKGAGIAVRTTSFTLENSVLANNVASNFGGALAVGLPGTSYSEIENQCPCPPTTTTGEIRFVVSHNNQAANGGSGLWIDAPAVTVHSSIFSGNNTSSVLVADASTAPSFSYNNVTPATFSGMPVPTGQNGNMSSPPNFVAPATGDFNLASGSLCIDAGHPDYIDVDGTAADMGRFGGLGGTL